MFSRDGFAEVARWISDRGVLILCGPNRRFVDRLLAAMSGARTTIFDGAKVHVPADVLEAAEKLMPTDVLVAIGGGAAVGLGKALRLTHDVPFAVIPTTYAGSEMTTIYGVTHANRKQTGRDPRVKPDLVVYDPHVTRDLPIALTVQSLFNAIAHVVSTGADLAFAHDVLRAIEELLVDPKNLDAREHAARAASAAAAQLDGRTPGAQHAIAHLLGGALNLEHAGLHAIVVPHFCRYANVDLGVDLVALLRRAGAPTTLRELGADEQAARDALATRPDLPPEIVRGLLA